MLKNIKSLEISVGSSVQHLNDEYIIRGRHDGGVLLLQSPDGKTTKKVTISTLLAEYSKSVMLSSKSIVLENIHDEDWDKAIHKRKIIRRVFEDGESVLTVAAQEDIHFTHIYNLRDKFEKHGIEGLLVSAPTGGAGKSRLLSQQEQVLVDSINDVYLTKQKVLPAEVVEEVKERCADLKIKPPARSTIYRRCNSVNEREKAKTRLGVKALKAITSQTFEGYQEVSRPLEVVQIDHTPVDVIVVDDETRKPIGRPYLTIAIDVYSRMVIGFFLSLDPPSRMSVALCLQHAVCNKDKWLSERGISHSWDIFGLPETIHVDNAKEFVSRTLRRGCDKYSIGIIYRPVGSPEYGGHVERFIGTCMIKVKPLPGATFSNISEKGEYDSEKESAMTLAELEKWFGLFFTGKYHKEVHSSLLMSPEQKFFEGLYGAKNIPGAGVNQVVIDEAELLMDFTPYDERTVQNYGLQISCIRYNSEDLNHLVNRKDPKTGNKMKFIVRRDPRDISEVYLLDPTTNQYITVPYADKSRPRMSLFELRWIREQLKGRGRIDKVTEDEIFQTRKELKALVENAKKETKRERRNRQRGKYNQLKSLENKPTSPPVIVNDVMDEDFSDDLEAFEEIELGEI